VNKKCAARGLLCFAKAVPYSGWHPPNFSVLNMIVWMGVVLAGLFLGMV
jgi:hypothetical protein